MSLHYFDQLQYGVFKDIEAIVDPKTRDLWIAQASVGRMLDLGLANRVSEKLASKSFKAFAGNGLACPKSVKAKDITGRANTVKAIPYDTFLKLVFWQSKQDNPAADALLLSGFTDSFTSLILDQCGIKVTVAERQDVLSQYLTGYHELFDWVRDEYKRVYGKPPTSGLYKQINMGINKGLFGFSSFNSDRVGNATTKQLRKIENTQMFIFDRIQGGQYSEIKNPVTRVQFIIAELFPQ
jgi:hypothetical protein